MQLSDIFDYKNQLMQDIVTNEEIVKLLNKDGEILPPEELIYKQVFPYEFLPETVVDGKTYICFETEVVSTYDKTYLQSAIYIWVFTHKSNLRLPEGGIRYDKICHEICKAINGSRFYGLGELELSSVRRSAPMEDYQGRLMTFYADEFNKQFNGKKLTPINRKR